MKEATSFALGIGLIYLAFALIPVGLKVTGYINVPWWVVLLPTYVPFACAFVGALGLSLIYFILNRK